MGVVSDEDAAAVAVEGGGDAEAAEQALEQAEIALRGFRWEELGSEDFSGGIVLHAESAEAGAAAFQPVVGTAVELDQFAFASRAQAALAMCRSATFAGRAEAFVAQEAAQSLAAERKALDLMELFGEMVVVEASILGAGQAQDSPASRMRFFKCLIWRTLRERSSAALAHAKSPLMQVLITLTRCSSF